MPIKRAEFERLAAGWRTKLSRQGLLDPDDARDMLAWVNGGFSPRELPGEYT